MKARPSRALWWIIIALVALQIFVVRELLAALALFAVVFIAFAAVVGVVRLLQLGWERLYTWGEDAGGEFSRKLARRPRSATAR
jgi:hypothetical protein